MLDTVGRGGRGLPPATTEGGRLTGYTVTFEVVRREQVTVSTSADDHDEALARVRPYMLRGLYGDIDLETIKVEEEQ